MQNFRIYGKPPYKVALLHGGPVVAIHGSFDSHPYQGVQEPLKAVVSNFTFILLDKCGHEPWIEKHAKDQFMNLISTHLLTL